MKWRDAARALGLLATCWFLIAAMPAHAQNPVAPPNVEWRQDSDPAQRYLQRSLEIFEFKRAAAAGVERGREIFYFKCWMCHNEFAKQAPRLDGLFKRETMVMGMPVNEDNVKNQIRNGSPNMASYKTTLGEADISDLVAFIREKCCWDSDAPPLNPRYIAH